MKMFSPILLLLTRSICFLGIIGFMHLSVQAQRTHVFGVGTGTVYYYGELTDEFNSSALKPTVTAFYQRYLSFAQRVSYKLAFTTGEIAATDATANDPGREVRNLHFKNRLYEGSAVVVIEALPDKNFGLDQFAGPHLTPYVFGGIAMFKHNPKARYQGEWYDLQPLGTEGQFLEANKGPYSLLQISFPSGVGFNLRLAQYAGVNVELGYRLTMTDYLDDISTVYPNLAELAERNGPLAAELSERSPEGTFEQGNIRGNPNTNDGYFFANFSITYYLSRFANR